MFFYNKTISKEISICELSSGSSRKCSDSDCSLCKAELTEIDRTANFIPITEKNHEYKKHLATVVGREILAFWETQSVSEILATNEIINTARVQTSINGNLNVNIKTRQDFRNRRIPRVQLHFDKGINTGFTKYKTPIRTISTHSYDTKAYNTEVYLAIYGEIAKNVQEGSAEYYKAAEEYALFGDIPEYSPNPSYRY